MMVQPPPMRCNARPPDPGPPLQLALIGLPVPLAEPVTMLAEIMGWQIMRLPGGPVMRPAAQLCLAMMPAGPADYAPLAAWSPDRKLNEHISQAGLSILDHPPCLSRLELLLGLAASQPGSGGVQHDAFQGDGQDGIAAGHGPAGGEPASWNRGA
ncbi:hypothetical protein CHU93_10220 [Sandarakinorhabdus cyanobacteriorum]|uniref:Uncharacterized protein n=2 Tax=Sandarakinorhabdus cyanobacteriorum TaxID=1981098 RepID=A0A255YEF5_9SPHN|nr:hypothetical protein CHU93_10220 [Sandarakinorhabdus cyanobacteriorum]